LTKLKLGHFIGLEVHDVGDWNAQPKARTDRFPEGDLYSTSPAAILKPHMVTTIEPGM
jgi:Xaa-Pro aminopeptidase